MTFYVTVYYREPVFEARIGRVGPPYCWTFEVDAPDAELAIAVARAEFEGLARDSSVGWSRVIVAWDVTMMPPRVATAP